MVEIFTEEAEKEWHVINVHKFMNAAGVAVDQGDYQGAKAELNHAINSLTALQKTKTNVRRGELLREIEDKKRSILAIWGGGNWEKVIEIASAANKLSQELKSLD